MNRVKVAEFLKANAITLHEVTSTKPHKTVECTPRQAATLGVRLTKIMSKRLDAEGYLVVYNHSTTNQHIAWIPQREFRTFYATHDPFHDKEWLDRQAFDLVAEAMGDDYREDYNEEASKWPSSHSEGWYE